MALTTEEILAHSNPTWWKCGDPCPSPDWPNVTCQSFVGHDTATEDQPATDHFAWDGLVGISWDNDRSTD